ncbi:MULTISPECIES: hypothetical protein [Halalkalibacter]|uniref:Uncharacterized protein n=1 Tax=Halalkalibacter alkaliphilus TaxID=2917993 RepID=A0A9X2I901_9BACI|nr:hypothetical protein [Halalkalibacter alkaliphilus]MCL7749154.1 hypothetical protein [Halalkalibacter alkaliphilus]
MKRKDVRRRNNKKKREMLKDFLKKNMRGWKAGSRRSPMPTPSRRTTA